MKPRFRGFGIICSSVAPRLLNKEPRPHRLP